MEENTKSVLGAGSIWRKTQRELLKAFTLVVALTITGCSTVDVKPFQHLYFKRNKNLYSRQCHACKAKRDS